jgi:hypothetical protein
VTRTLTITVWRRAAAARVAPPAQPLRGIPSATSVR